MCVSHAADLRSLARLIPAESRLVINPGAAPGTPSQPGADALRDGTALELVTDHRLSPCTPAACPRGAEPQHTAGLLGCSALMAGKPGTCFPLQSVQVMPPCSPRWVTASWQAWYAAGRVARAPR